MITLPAFSLLLTSIVPFSTANVHSTASEWLRQNSGAIIALETKSESALANSRETIDVTVLNNAREIDGLQLQIHWPASAGDIIQLTDGDWEADNQFVSPPVTFEPRNSDRFPGFVSRNVTKANLFGENRITEGVALEVVFEIEGRSFPLIITPISGSDLNDILLGPQGEEIETIPVSALIPAIVFVTDSATQRLLLGQTNPFPFSAGDINGDAIVDAADIVRSIQIPEPTS